MHMLVDDTGNQEFTRGVNDFSIRSLILSMGCLRVSRPFNEIRGLVPSYYFGNQAILNKNTCHESLALVDKCRIFYVIIHTFFLGLIFPVMPLHRKLSTPKTASLKMPLLIFDWPSRRSVKMIGTSSILKPSFQAVYFISIWKA